jgi:transcriptional regulator with XRE-family HTH domain
MTKRLSSEKLFLEELMQAAQKASWAARGLSIGLLIKGIRTQLGMSQKALAKHASIPQSTISRVEKGVKGVTIPILHKILNALCCDLLLVPILRESIDAIRHKQARKLAELHVRYLKGTMNLEEQQPDPRLLEELLTEEEQRLLHGSSSELWGK